MKENKQIDTPLHIASEAGNKKIVKLLLKTFTEKEKDKLMEYVKKENDNKMTALHFAVYKKHEEIVKLLSNVFSDEEKQNLQYLIKENKEKHIALQIATNTQEENQQIEMISIVPNTNQSDEIIEILVPDTKQQKVEIIL